MLKIISQKVEAAVKKLVAKKRLGSYPRQEKIVAKIVGEVKKFGDNALLKYTKKFASSPITLKNIRVTTEEIKQAYDKVSSQYVAAIKLAAKNITAYHKKQKPDQWFETYPHDVVLGLRNIPLGRVGIYVPGGTAIYPSTVLMNAIPAQVAEVKEIVMATPLPSPHVLVAANEIGITDIYKIGGAQAIAALAYGTKTIPKVDKIVGPGNIYVTLAKKLVYGVVGIDKLAGPSDVCIVADEDASPEFVAADLLAQAEHDPEASAVLVTTSPKIAQAVQKEVSKQLLKLSRSQVAKQALSKNGAIFVVKNIDEAAAIVNQIAPEHLELMIDIPHRRLEKFQNAGAVFLGPYSPETVGDYIAGPNHVLPTSGTARFSSPLGVYDFIKHQSVIGYTKPGLESVREELKELTRVEGLEGHGKAVEIRFS